MSEMRKIFAIEKEAETRVWTMYMSNTYDLLSNLEYTVNDAGLYQGQVYMSVYFLIQTCVFFFLIISSSPEKSVRSKAVKGFAFLPQKKINMKEKM